MNQFHNPDDEPSCPTTIKISIDDNKKYSTAEYRYVPLRPYTRDASSPSLLRARRNELYADIKKKKKEQKKAAKKKREKRKTTKKKREKKEKESAPA